MTRCVRFFACALLVVVAGCSAAPTDSDATSVQWRYNGTQRMPTLVRIEGALVLTRVSGDRFEGSLDVLRTDALGQVERVRGLVAGRNRDNTMDFEANLDGNTVRHVGRVVGDSVSGTWLDDSGLGSLLVSGDFVLVRAP